MKPYGNSLIMDFSKAFIARPFMMSFKIRENPIKPIKTNRARVEIELKLSLSLRQKVITSPHDLLLIRKFVCRTEAINVWPNFRKSIKSKPEFLPTFLSRTGNGEGVGRVAQLEAGLVRGEADSEFVFGLFVLDCDFVILKPFDLEADLAGFEAVGGPKNK